VKQQAKVVVRYEDGRILKGTTLNFDPARPMFLLNLNDVPGAKPLEVRLRELKAVFFVRDLVGDAEYMEQKHFEKPTAGQRVTVTFADGEQLIGVTLSYDPTRDGFFLFPADPRSNNERVFVLRRSVVKVERQPVASSPRRTA
jgi:small nuclear ribonucleoprotein (snRNP)-like protein